MAPGPGSPILEHICRVCLDGSMPQSHPRVDNILRCHGRGLDENGRTCFYSFYQLGPSWEMDGGDISDSLSPSGA